MPDVFQLPPADRRDAMEYAADRSGRPAHWLEKDLWVVWALKTLFTGPFCTHLIFKGGTSLSKAYGIIRRFSEDVDLTYDIRAIAGDLVSAADKNLLPRSRSQQQRWSQEIRSRMSQKISAEIVPTLAQALREQGLPAAVRAEGERAFIDYALPTGATSYVRPSVLLEFGARSSGEPHESRTVVCDAAPYLTEVDFPTAIAQVMLPERTFWEKATAIHVFCAQGRFRSGERFSRHWHDLTRLDRAGRVDRAIADRPLARAVADHKAAFFPEKDASANRINYLAAVSGHLHLVPEGSCSARLADDYRQMIEDGLLLEDVESFDQLIEECRRIQDKANRPLTGESPGT